MDELELTDRLRSIVRSLDAPPDLSRRLAEAALDTLRLDEELAQLLADSFDGVPELVRSDGDAPRMVTFEWAEINIDLEISSGSTHFDLRGLISGTTGGRIELEATTRVSTTPDGSWFVFDHVEHGPFRLHFHPGDGRSLVTGWVNVCATD